jgi:hypothetical protein
LCLEHRELALDVGVGDRAGVGLVAARQQQHELVPAVAGNLVVGPQLGLQRARVRACLPSQEGQHLYRAHTDALGDLRQQAPGF